LVAYLAQDELVEKPAEAQVTLRFHGNELRARAQSTTFMGR
jgi:hypothetical protein